MWLMCPIKLLQTRQWQLLPTGPWVQIGSVSLPQGGGSEAREQQRLALPAARSNPGQPWAHPLPLPSMVGETHPFPIPDNPRVFCVLSLTKKRICCCLGLAPSPQHTPPSKK